MARMRYIKPEYWTDRKIVGLSLAARLLYIGTWNFALCDKGHLEDDAFRLKMQIFPADNVDVDAALDELISAGCITRLEDPDGSTYLLIVHLKDHQKVDPRWSTRCAACKESDSLTETLPASPKLSETLQSSPVLSQTLRNSPQEGRGGDGIGGEKDSTTATSPATPSSASEFDAFWAIYPKKVGGKVDAKKAFVKAVRLAGLDAVMAGVKRYAADPNIGERQFIPNPATWLNQGRWEDDPCAPRTDKPNTTPRAGSTIWDRTVRSAS